MRLAPEPCTVPTTLWETGAWGTSSPDIGRAGASLARLPRLPHAQGRAAVTALALPAFPLWPITIGIGHTGGVRMGDACTEEQAMGWLRSDVGSAEVAVSELVAVALKQGQFDALVSFAFNLERGTLAG